MREFIIPEDYIIGGWLELESDYIERECKEVIRCKDCKNQKYIGTSANLCPMQIYLGDDGFCSRAEHRGEE